MEILPTWASSTKRPDGIRDSRMRTRVAISLVLLFAFKGMLRIPGGALSDLMDSRILAPKFKDDFGGDAPTAWPYQEPAVVAPQRAPPAGRPELPPSPVRGPPAFDKTFNGNRLIVRFKLEAKDADGNYTLRAALALNSAPGARFSSLTFSIRLTDGSILAIFPETAVGPESETEFTNDKSLQATV